MKGEEDEWTQRKKNAVGRLGISRIGLLAQTVVG